tara:strand:+ start:4371 stop:4661 length:291 start_codon:yes stop_codon:yes gene_type:complete
MSNLPFNEIILETNSKYTRVLREFSNNLDSEDLYWHKDKEDRLIKKIKGHEWYIQLENNIPCLIPDDSFYFIPKNTWHRILNKNNTNLVIEVRKLK